MFIQETSEREFSFNFSLSDMQVISDEEREEERRGRKEREGRERGKGRRKVHVVLLLDQSFHVRPVASVKNRVWAPSLEKLGHNYNSIYGHVDQSAQGSSTSSHRWSACRIFRVCSISRCR